MAFLVSVTQVESNKLPVAALEIAFVNLLGIVVELMPITMMTGQLELVSRITISGDNKQMFGS